MQHMKNKKSKQLLIIALASLIAVSTAAASVMTGCGENSEETSATKTIVETSVVTRVNEDPNPTDENGNEISVDNISSNNSENKTNNASSANGDSSSSKNGNSANGNTANGNSGSNNSGNGNSGKGNAGGGNSSNGNSGNSNSSNGNSNNGNSGNSNSANGNSSNSGSNHSGNGSSSKVCTLDGNKYNVGDTVTCVFYLTAPKVLENYQATIRYDSKYLKVQSARLNAPASYGGVLNFKLSNRIEFNGSSISPGFDYTKGGEFVTVTYEIVSAGSTTTSVEWVVATELSMTSKHGTSYVKDGKAVNGMKLTKKYS